MDADRSTRAIRWIEGREEIVDDSTAWEEPLEIRVETRPISVTMRTPGADAELALGFLRTEGVIASKCDILEIRQSDPNRIDVFIRPDLAVDFNRLSRNVFAGSSCGVCGKASIDAVMEFQTAGSHTAEFPLDPRTILQAPHQMRAAQKGFEATGGLHAAALLDRRGEILCLREDIGRHNAVDKVIGWLLDSEIQNADTPALLVSGRVSFEIIQKAASVGLPCVLAVSAPSNLAVEFAKRAGITLIGFLRDNRFNIYSREDRALLTPASAKEDSQ